MGFSGVPHEYFDRCDDEESEKEQVCEPFVTRKRALQAAGLPTTQNLSLGDLEVTIDAEGHVKGSLKPENLPQLPDLVGDDARRKWSALEEIAVVSGEFGVANRSDDRGIAKGRSGMLTISTLQGGRQQQNTSCDMSFSSTDYKAVIYCAASRAACRSDSDCCNHNCVPSTRSCR